jgi:hypothetical protein
VFDHTAQVLTSSPKSFRHLNPHVLVVDCDGCFDVELMAALGGARTFLNVTRTIVMENDSADAPRQAQMHSLCAPSHPHALAPVQWAAAAASSDAIHAPPLVATLRRARRRCNGSAPHWRCERCVAASCAHAVRREARCAWLRDVIDVTGRVALPQARCLRVPLDSLRLAPRRGGR